MALGLILSNGDPTEDLALARRAERAGFGAVYCFDFFASNALVRLGAIAAANIDAILDGAAGIFSA